MSKEQNTNNSEKGNKMKIGDFEYTAEMERGLCNYHSNGYCIKYGDNCHHDADNECQTVIYAD